MLYSAFMNVLFFSHDSISSHVLVLKVRQDNMNILFNPVSPYITIKRRSSLKRHFPKPRARA